MTTIWVSSSDEYLSSQENIQRSLTLGPSRVWRPPIPTRNPFRHSHTYSLHDEDPRSQRTRGESHTSTNTTRPPLQPGSSRTYPHSYVSGSNQYQLPTNLNQSPEFPPIGYQWPRNYPAPDPDTQNLQGLFHSHPPMSPTRYPSPPDPHDSFDPWPEEDTDSDSDKSERELNLFVDPDRQRRDSDPLNPHGGDYEWPELTNTDRAIFRPHQTAAWELRQQDFD